MADARGAPSLVVSNNHTVAPKGFHFEGAGAGAASLMSGGAYTSYHGQPLSLSSVSEHLIVEDDAQLASPGNGSVRLWHLRGEETPISVDLSKACQGRGATGVRAVVADVGGRTVGQVPVSRRGSLATVQAAATGTVRDKVDSYQLSWSCTGAEPLIGIEF